MGWQTPAKRTAAAACQRLRYLISPRRERNREREGAGAKFSQCTDCPHESHFTLSTTICAADSSASVRQAGRRFFFFFGSIHLWLSLLPTHTQISRVTVTETGISKSSSIFLWLPPVTKTLNSHTQPVNRAAIITSVTPFCCITEKSLCFQKDRHIYLLCNIALIVEAFNWFFLFQVFFLPVIMKHYEICSKYIRTITGLTFFCSLFFLSPGSLWLHSQRPHTWQPYDASTMQWCDQTRCCPAAEGRGAAPAQEPVPERRLSGGVPGALPRQDPTTVPRDHQAQPGPVLACFLSNPRINAAPPCVCYVVIKSQTQPCPRC